MLSSFTSFAHVAGLFVLSVAVGAASSPNRTEEVFQEYEDRVVQVRVLERGSGSKSGIGSGFFVSDSGHVMTNFHVISEAVHEPDSYRLEVILRSGAVFDAALRDIDVVHDLAVVDIDYEPEQWFPLEPATPKRGQRLFAMGNPRDLGFHIVEGTYNGPIENSLYEKLNFTGSLNPGMSGGPTISRDGRVVGVNVATQGNQLSFLVPVSFAKLLLSRSRIEKPIPLRAFSSRVRSQLIDNQAAYMSRLMSAEQSLVDLGRYQVPGAIASFFRCWAQVDEERAQQTYESISQVCSTQDTIYVSRRLLTGSVTFRHEYLSAQTLNRFQFYTLYQSKFKQQPWSAQASEEDVTSFSCHTDFTKTSGGKAKTVFCARAYRKFQGLYDVVVLRAALDGDTSGLLSTMILTGVSFSNAQAFSRQFLENIAWKN